MQRRFYSDQPILGEFVSLSGPDAHHIANVLRLKSGDQIVLFDGSGKEFVAEISEIRKKEINLNIVGFDLVSRELRTDLTVCVAFPKGDRQKVLVEKLVELGVRRVVPLHSERSVVNLNSKSLTKVDRWVVEASKQCGRNVLMTVEDPCTFAEMVERKNAGIRFMAHPYPAGDRSSNWISQVNENSPVVIAIGPEGGFTDEEIDNAKEAGWTIVQLGSSILRIETAALALTAILGIGREW